MEMESIESDESCFVENKNFVFISVVASELFSYNKNSLKLFRNNKFIYHGLPNSFIKTVPC